jgi:cytochrome c biogenesis protein CcdA
MVNLSDPLESSVVLLGLAGLAGLATVLSPCILPILPILVGRSLHNHPYGPFVLVGGLASSFAVTGCLLGISSQILAPLSSWIRQGSIFLLLGLGLVSAFPNLSHSFWQRIRRPQWGQTETGSPLLTEFWIGTQLGVVWIPCAGPILGSILTIVVVDQSFLIGFTALFIYALGAGIPMLALAYMSKQLIPLVKSLYPHTALLQRASGILISLTAIGILLGWDVQLQLQLARFFPDPIL